MTSIKPNDPRLDMAADAFRGAMSNIQVGLRLLGELRAEAVKGDGPPQGDPDRPAMFRPRTKEGSTPATSGGSITTTEG